MSVSFSKDEVHKHLLDLGYSNITNDQLREFMTDLKRLIRYEEKQKRIEAHVQYANKHSKYNKAETTEITQDIQGEEVRSNNILQHERLAYYFRNMTKSSIFTRKTDEYNGSLHTESIDYMKQIRRQESDYKAPSHLSKGSVESRRQNTFWEQNTRNIQSMDVIRSRRYSEARETLGESTAEEYQIQIQLPQNIPTKTFKKPSKENVRPISAKSTAVGSKESRADFDGGCWEMVNQDAVQILPPKPKIPTKPTTSCIKPTFNEKQKKDLRRDPVRLHDYYKKQWEKLKLPGDESRSTKELRWAVREWMMGRKPPE